MDGRATDRNAILTRGSDNRATYAGRPTSTSSIPRPLDSATDGVLDFVDENLVSEEEFDEMIGDLRRTFVGWLRRTDTGLGRIKEGICRERRALADELKAKRKELENERRLERERLKEERRRLEDEFSSSLRQIKSEREEMRKKMGDERIKVDAEKEKQRKLIIMEKERLAAEIERFDMETRKIVDNNMATEAVSVLNVGGVIFETSRHNLTHQDSSLLAAYFSGRHKVSRDKSGRPFIDRDPDLFRLIVNFLRDPDVPPAPRDLVESDALAREAAYYSIKFYPSPLCFAMGGLSSRGHLSSVEVLADNGWRGCRSMPGERAYGAGVGMLGRMYYLGGQDSDFRECPDVFVYDVLSDMWFEGPTMFDGVRNQAACVHSDRIWSIAGFDGNSILSSVMALDPRAKGWMTMPSLSEPRSASTASAFDGGIVVCGGTNGERLKTTEVFDSRANKWRPGPSMIDVRSAACSASLFEHVYVIGGVDNTHDPLNSIECIDREKYAWSYRSSCPFKLSDAACGAMTRSLVVTGGGDSSKETYLYKPDIDEWQTGPDLMTGRYAHECVVINL